MHLRSCSFVSVIIISLAHRRQDLSDPNVAELASLTQAKMRSESDENKPKQEFPKWWHDLKSFIERSYYADPDRVKIGDLVRSRIKFVERYYRVVITNLTSKAHIQYVKKEDLEREAERLAAEGLDPVGKTPFFIE